MSDARITKCFKQDELYLLYIALKKGDLLEFQRTGYAHWAVYVGVREFEGEMTHCVVHRAIPRDATKRSLFLASRSTRQMNKLIKTGHTETESFGKIHLQDIESVLGNDRVRINNQSDSKWRPKEVGEIVARADAALVSTDNKPYHLLSNNCEHFANSCRYGKNVSRQVSDIVLKTVSTVGGVIIPIATRSAIVAAGVTAAGPVGLAVTGTAIGVGVLSAAVPLVVHAVQSRNKK